MASTGSQTTFSSMASTSYQTPSSSVSYLEPFLSSQTPPSSSSTSPPTTWDVFLSFRGEDTRYTFTDHLYTALCRYNVRTFIDKEQLRTGEVISDTLIQAIRESKTYVVVFSENYASSTWCLDELAEIYSCYETMNRLVIGVYYNINPSVVRYQTGSFKKAFKKHKTRAKIGFFKKASKEHRIRSAVKMEKVKNWGLTLTKIAGISGQPISAERSEADIVTEIVGRILTEINPKTLFVAKYPVGLDSRVENVTALLSSTGTKGVTKIGLYGMGGVGKTTLAKAVYNQNHHRFEGCCFLENVREGSLTNEGKVSLQRQLINNVLKCDNINVDNVDHGIELIKARVCSTKILVVIDDLDDPKPLDFLEGPFHVGSIIMITTRNEDLLDSIKVETRYKVNELSDAESRQLFTQHASGDGIISDTFADLSQEILQRAGGLPLALTVFGSKLFNDESDEGWKWFIDTLKRVSNKDVEDSLLISFDALKLKDPMMQNIFLDIACLFIGREEEEVVKIMETYYSFVHQNIGILKKRSLVTINNRYNKLEMHNLLWDMGKRIAHNSSPDEPGRHSRLWILEDICEVLKKHKGTEAIEGIVPHNLYCQNALEGVSFTTEAFKRMSKLRFLHLNNVKLTGSFEQKFEDLRWLCWEFCPLECLPPEFHPQKLVILSFPFSKMRTMWEVSQDFKELKSLNMSYSLDLTTTPEFTKLQRLETLNLEGCKSLEEVHISIGSLNRLVSLNLHGCVELRFLGDTLCDLKALKVLNIGYCRMLEELPTKLGNIKSLTELNAEGLTICKLPDSIGGLSKLVHLRLSNNEKLETLPATICELRSLQILDISGCRKMLKVTRLMELDASGATMLKKLSYIEPSQIALSGNVLTAMPSAISQCLKPDLKDGILQMVSIAGLPPNLKVLNADSCTSMERLPDLSDLTQLEILNLRDCSGLTEIPGLKKLTTITGLHLTGCNLPLLERTLTNHFFQIYSQVRHKIDIYTTEFPDWISQSIGSTVSVVNNVIGEPSFRSTVSLDFMPNVAHNILGTILCFEPSQSDSITYSVNNTTSDFIWSGTSHNTCHKSLMVFVPRSIFSVTGADKGIELTADTEIYGIHVLHKMAQDSTPID